MKHPLWRLWLLGLPCAWCGMPALVLEVGRARRCVRHAVADTTPCVAPNPGPHRPITREQVLAVDAALPERMSREERSPLLGVSPRTLTTYRREAREVLAG